MYYGAYALRDAMNAAASGDIINLSGGGFQAVDITKGVTLRGTGIDDAAPTYITGSFNINIPAADANRLSMEGIRCTDYITMLGTFNSPYFIKSHFKTVYYDTNSAIKNAMFANCRIYENLTLKGSSTTQFLNCYLDGFYNSGYPSTAATFINCVLRPYSDGYYPDYICQSQLLNCVIYQSYYSLGSISRNLPASTIATNCVSIGFYNLFGAQPANTNNYNATFAEVFKDFTGSYSDSQTFELTDEAKTKYLGNDGTQVGMYGGVLPYSSTPSYPQITKMNVANKTTADGKLSVEIEVSAAK